MDKGFRMFEAVAFLYAMLTSVVFAGANRNHKLGQPHPPLLAALGYVVVGSLAAVAIGLMACAAMGIDPLAGFVPTA